MNCDGSSLKTIARKFINGKLVKLSINLRKVRIGAYRSHFYPHWLSPGKCCILKQLRPLVELWWNFEKLELLIKTEVL